MGQTLRLFLRSAAFLLIAQTLSAQTEGIVRGRVVDAQTNEPIAKAQVSLPGTGQHVETGANGEFLFSSVPTGRVTVQVSTANYGLLRKALDLGPGSVTELEIALNQEAGSIATSVEVRGNLFEGIDGAATPSAQTLSKNELQAVGTDFVADPLRAVQALPSVTTSNDARGEISIRGSSFDRVAVMVDGILVDGFLHQAQGDRVGNEGDKATFSILSTDRIASASVLPGALPASYGLRTAGVVNFETREGNRVKPDVRITTGFLLGTSIVVDGPFAGKRASYLVGVRSSAIDYLNKLSDPSDTGTVFNDGQLKLSYDLTTSNKLTASSFFGNYRDDDRTGALPFGKNTASRTRAFSNANILSWDWTVQPTVLVQTKLFHLQTNIRQLNRERVILSRQPDRQWGLRQDWNITARRGHLFALGTYLRSIQAEGFAQQFTEPSQIELLVLENYRGSTTEPSFYASDSYTVPSGHFTITAGLRAEHNRISRETVLDPRVSVAWGSPAGWQLRAGWGRQHQFARIGQLLASGGNRTLHAEEARHAIVAVERALGERSRVSVELFDRAERRQIFALNEPRLLMGQIAVPNGRLENSLSGYARGLEVMIQRRSANRLSGWLSYTWLTTELRDPAAGLVFPADGDQRHAARVFAAYRLTSTWNFSALWRYGSGQPYQGFLERRATGVFLSEQRNRLRLPAYSRVDLRLSKAFSIWRSRWTFSVEGVNITNRKNLTFAGLDSLTPSGQVLEPTSAYLARFVTMGVVIQF